MATFDEFYAISSSKYSPLQPNGVIKDFKDKNLDTDKYSLVESLKKTYQVYPELHANLMTSGQPLTEEMLKKAFESLNSKKNDYVPWHLQQLWKKHQQEMELLKTDKGLQYKEALIGEAKEVANLKSLLKSLKKWKSGE